MQHKNLSELEKKGWLSIGKSIKKFIKTKCNKPLLKCVLVLTRLPICLGCEIPLHYKVVLAPLDSNLSKL